MTSRASAGAVATLEITLMTEQLTFVPPLKLAFPSPLSSQDWSQMPSFKDMIHKGNRSGDVLEPPDPEVEQRADSGMTA